MRKEKYNLFEVFIPGPDEKNYGQEYYKQVDKLLKDFFSNNIDNFSSPAVFRVSTDFYQKKSEELESEEYFFFLLRNLILSYITTDKEVDFREKRLGVPKKLQDYMIGGSALLRLINNFPIVEEFNIEFYNQKENKLISRCF
jgi:hypothetical protein